MNGVRGTKGRNRGQHSKVISQRTTSMMLSDAGKYYASFDVMEDKSLTRQQHLTLFGGRGLLNRGNPFDTDTTFIRETSRSHRRVVEKEVSERSTQDRTRTGLRVKV